MINTHIGRLIRIILLSPFIFSHLFAVEINNVNSATIGLYEKFEVILDIDDSAIVNPYDPNEINITARFVSPSGVEWNVVGFYDDYLGRDEWKVRFSPNEVGQWSYLVSNNSIGKRSTTEVQTFDAVASEHHGWIQVSEENPHYFSHDDGTAFYGVGSYAPWRNSVATFDTLEQYGANMFGIWNITYGGMVNGAGLIEEELGRYNQLKCGRIDSLLEISAERGLHAMLAIWPHDLFSQTVWAHQWHINPYNQICDVVDVYSDSLCWEYQKQQYRYLLARFAHNRGFGMWEIMNEINGTDGWAQGRTQEAADWVHKVHNYFKENDPYNHPTTASRSGGYGEYWGDTYELFDVANLHVYETQGWPQTYTGNPLRSSMANYAFGAARFWQNFDQPAIFGEAGWDWVFVDVNSPDYSKLYHNALWVSLTNGLAATPIWWVWNDPLDKEDWQQMAHFSKFVKNIDFINESREPFSDSTDELDLFGMKSESTAFGWIRLADNPDISNTKLHINGDFNKNISVWAITYFNTWSGDTLDVHIRPNLDGVLYDQTPQLDAPHPDVAFTARAATGGETPVRLQLWADDYEILNIDTLKIPLTCFLFDDQDRFCGAAQNNINFTLDGSGSLSTDNVDAENGAARLTYSPGAETGDARIIASSTGLASDTLTIHIKDRALLDNFESYGSTDALRSVWQKKSSTTADVYLDEAVKGSGDFSMRLDYGIGPGYKIYARIEKIIEQDYSGDYLSFWLKPDGSERLVQIAIRDANNTYWTYDLYLIGNEPRYVNIPIREFESGASGVLNLDDMKIIRLTIRKGTAEDGTGTIYLDDISFTDVPTKIAGGNRTTPNVFRLYPNFPNPFNPSTTIAYALPEAGSVQIFVYNMLGEKVATLVDEKQSAGLNTIEWDASTLPSGLYFYNISAGRFQAQQKCLLVK
jgi:hypothetical protein